MRQGILDALGDTRVVYVMGARQVGKSTLVTSIAENEHPAEVRTLDDEETLEEAQADPVTFVRNAAGPMVIDEVQLVPDLIRAVKREVDQRPAPGKFLLTGSANFLLDPNVTESLAGRVELIQLWPFSQGELEGSRESFIDDLFSDRVADAPPGVQRVDIAERIVRGGFPEASIRADDRRRAAWFSSHIDTAVKRDLGDIAAIRRLSDVPTLLKLLAGRAAGLLEPGSIANDLSLARETTKSYIQLLETLFLVHTLPSWRRRVGKRAVQARKVYIVDSGMHAYLLGAGRDRVLTDRRIMGSVFENFVAMEIVRQAGWAETDVGCHHYRDRDGYEVDLVLEDRAGRVVGIDAKSSATVREQDFRGLGRLRNLAGDDFAAGAVVHLGSGRPRRHGDFWSVPVNALWAARGHWEGEGREPEPPPFSWVSRDLGRPAVDHPLD